MWSAKAVASRWDEQYDVRTLLREQNVTEWVIVSTGIFTSFLFEPAFGVVNLAKTINALGGWEMQVTVTSPADIGRLTTEIYLHQPRITNEVVFVAGKRPLMQNWRKRSNA